MRSPACSLLANSADESEIREMIDDDLRAVLPVAIAGVSAESAPAQLIELVAALTSFSGLVGQEWTRAGREEFITLAANELEDMPGGMVMDALARARKRVTAGRLLVSWICDDVEPRAAKLKAEHDTLLKLIDLAAPAA